MLFYKHKIVPYYKIKPILKSQYFLDIGFIIFSILVKYLFLIMVCIFDIAKPLRKKDWYSIILEDIVPKHFISIQYIDIESV